MAETFSLIPKNATSTWVLGGGGGQRARKLKNALQINTGRFNDMLHSGKQNQKWPTSGQGGYITPTAWGVPNASERGTKSEVDHKWAQWLHNPCRPGGPQHFRAGDNSGRKRQKWPISGPVGPVDTSMHLMLSVKLENIFAVSHVQKEIVMLCSFFASSVRKIVTSCSFILR